MTSQIDGGLHAEHVRRVAALKASPAAERAVAIPCAASEQPRIKAALAALDEATAGLSRYVEIQRSAAPTAAGESEFIKRAFDVVAWQAIVFDMLDERFQTRLDKLEAMSERLDRQEALRMDAKAAGPGARR